MTQMGLKLKLKPQCQSHLPGLDRMDVPILNASNRLPR